MPWTRRHPFREVLNGVKYILSFLEEKTDEHRRLSQFNIILMMFSIAFIYHWPIEWNEYSRDVVALILLALPVRDIMRLIPGREALAAVQSFFGGFVARTARNIRRGFAEEDTEEEVEETPKTPNEII